MARILDRSTESDDVSAQVAATRALLQAAVDAPARSLLARADLLLARNVGLADERKQTALRLGADDPDVTALDQEIADNQQIARAAAAAARRLSVEVPKPKPDEWIVHGWVQRAEDEGVGGVTVAVLLNGKSVAEEKTNADGYYRIVVSRERLQALAGKDSKPVVTVRASDAQGVTLVEPRDRFDPVAGTVDALAMHLPQPAKK
jgi:hypothetical protein